MALARALLLCALATAPAGEGLLVLAKSSREALLVDVSTLATRTTFPTGEGPHEVAVSPDGRRAYVTNYGLHGVFRPGEKPAGDPGSTVTVLDLGAGTVAGTFELGSQAKPHGVAVSRDGSRLWVTCEGQQAVVELDARDGTRLRTWATGQAVSHMLVATPDDRKLYVASIGSGTVTVIDRASGATSVIPSGDGTEGIDVTPDGREVWATNRGAGTITVIDTGTDRVVATVSSGGAMPIRVRFAPSGKEAWVSNARSNAVVVLDVASRRPLASVRVGAMPVGLVISPDGKRVFVAATNSNQVFVIDAARRAVVTSFRPGEEPDGMAWAWAPSAPGKKR